MRLNFQVKGVNCPPIEIYIKQFLIYQNNRIEYKYNVI